jgi:hypothetical protein
VAVEATGAFVAVTPLVAACARGRAIRAAASAAEKIILVFVFMFCFLDIQF